jgi:hypothetical protein
MACARGKADPKLLLKAEEFARRRGWPVQSLAKACDAHRIFCLKPEGVAVYPAFFVDPRYKVRQLEAITKRLGDMTGGSKWLFFTNTKGSLGGVTPLQALLAGKYALVMRVAQAYFER